MNDIFVKLLEALQGEGMFYADFNDTQGETIYLQKEDIFFEINLKGKTK